MDVDLKKQTTVVLSSYTLAEAEYANGNINPVEHYRGLLKDRDPFFNSKKQPDFSVHSLM